MMEKEFYDKRTWTPNPTLPGQYLCLLLWRGDKFWRVLYFGRHKDHQDDEDFMMYWWHLDDYNNPHIYPIDNEYQIVKWVELDT